MNEELIKKFNEFQEEFKKQIVNGTIKHETTFETDHNGYFARVVVYIDDEHKASFAANKGNYVCMHNPFMPFLTKEESFKTVEWCRKEESECLKTSKKRRIAELKKELDELESIKDEQICNKNKKLFH